MFTLHVVAVLVVAVLVVAVLVALYVGMAAVYQRVIRPL